MSKTPAIWTPALILPLFIILPCFYLIKITPELFEITWLNAALTTALTILIYFGAILLFNLEPELRNYLRNGVRHVIKNLRN